MPDEAYFKKLPNGDDLEIGSTPCPHKASAVTDYEEVWRDVTAKPLAASSWILQSQDETSFVGRVGNVFLAIRKDSDGAFSVRKDALNSLTNSWDSSFKSHAVDLLPDTDDSVKAVEAEGEGLVEGNKVQIGDGNFVVRAFAAQ